MKIIVTGGAGFVGSKTVDALVKKGHDVFVIDNLITGKKENLNLQAKFFDLNIADNKGMKRVFKIANPDVVYHFAYNVDVPLSTSNPISDLDSIAGSMNLLDLSNKHKVKKIIFSSSVFVYGNTSDLPINEETIIKPDTPYSISKSMVEMYLKFYYKTHNLPYTILRYATVYGPGQKMGAMSDYVRKLNNNKQAKMWGNGNKTRDYVYINDVVRANLMVMSLKRGVGEVYNIGTGTETTLNELYSKLAKLLGKNSKPIYLPDRPGELYKSRVDYSKIKKEFGWVPEFDLEKGLKERLRQDGYNI